jgi:hypothetical protein
MHGVDAGGRKGFSHRYAICSEVNAMCPPIIIGGKCQALG